MKRLNRLQRELLLWIGLCLITTVATSLYIETSSADYSMILRFHVMANSDSEEDQKLKLKVRDKIVSTLEEDIPKTAKKNNLKVSQGYTREYVKKHLWEINKMAEEVVLENGYKYKTTARLGVVFIPEKTYGDITFPAGNYEALNISIGSGNGHNWFCVIYPPLCLVKKNKHKAIKLKSKVKCILKHRKKRT